MKVSPVSADLLIEVAVVGGVLVGAAYLAHKLTGAITAPGALNPADPRNLANSGVNALGNAIASSDPNTAGRNADGSWNDGFAVFDFLHPGTTAAIRALSGPVAPAAPPAAPLYPTAADAPGAWG